MCERTVRIIHMDIEIWRGEALNLSVVTDSLMIYSLTTCVCKILSLCDMQIFRCLAILRRDNSTGSWVFFIWLSFLPPFSLTAVLPPCEIKKEKKKKP